MGMAYVTARSARPRIGPPAGSSPRWTLDPAVPGICPTIPRHRLLPQGLRAFIDVLKEVDRLG